MDHLNLQLQDLMRAVATAMAMIISSRDLSLLLAIYRAPFIPIEVFNPVHANAAGISNTTLNEASSVPTMSKGLCSVDQTQLLWFRRALQPFQSIEAPTRQPKNELNRNATSLDFGLATYSFS